MNFIEISLIGIGLAMDCFAVAVSLGLTRKLLVREILRMAFFFGYFQGMMTLVGWWLGSVMKPVIEAVDHWLAFSILAVIGLKMIVESYQKDEDNTVVDIGNTRLMLSLSVATSIDALMTGVSFGFIKVNIWLALVLISTITFLISFAGGKVGGKTAKLPAKKAEILGGLVLIVIGFKILLEHL